jgi:hypothetical protein
MKQIAIKEQIKVFILLIIIFSVLLYFVLKDKIYKVEYKQFGEIVCIEIYINNKLNGTSCEDYYNAEDKWKLINDYENSELIPSLN